MGETRHEGPRVDQVATRVSIVDLVFQDRECLPRGRIPFAAALTVGVYSLVAILLGTREPGHGPWSAELATQIHARLSNEQSIEILPAPPRPPLQAADSPPRVSKVVRPPPIRTAGRTVRRTSAVAPAQAASLVTRTATESPLDLTGDTFATGGAASFPGGATAGAGRSSAPVAGAVDVHAPATHRETPAGPDQARPVTLADGTWSCPWPAEADAEQIDEQTVVIRVRVEGDGSVDSAEVVSDPGHGFGLAATTCARRTRFQAARNGRGASIASWSPPIRVHFSR